MTDASAPVRRLETDAWAFGLVRFAAARGLLGRVQASIPVRLVAGRRPVAQP